MEFEGDGIELIASETSGIPALVELFDQLLVKRFQGANVNKESLLQIIEMFRAQAKALGRKLFESDSNSLLSEREKQIVRMVAKVSLEVEANQRISEFLVEDELFQDDELKAVGPDDIVDLRVIQCIGLVPVDDSASSTLEKLVSVERTDALYMLLENAES